MAWFTNRKNPSRVACEVADAFLAGPIAYHELNPLGVSEISIWFNGAFVRASWYSPDSPRSLTISDKPFPGVGTTDSMHIMEAAMSRASVLVDEELQKIAKR